MVVHSFLLSVVGCYVADGDVAPVSGVKRSRAGGVMVLTSTLSIVGIHHVLLLLVHCWLLHRIFDVAPAFQVRK